MFQLCIYRNISFRLIHYYSAICSNIISLFQCYVFQWFSVWPFKRGARTVACWCRATSRACTWRGIRSSMSGPRDEHFGKLPSKNGDFTVNICKQWWTITCITWLYHQTWGCYHQLDSQQELYIYTYVCIYIYTYVSALGYFADELRWQEPNSLYQPLLASILHVAPWSLGAEVPKEYITEYVQNIKLKEKEGYGWIWVDEIKRSDWIPSPLFGCVWK